MGPVRLVPLVGALLASSAFAFRMHPGCDTSLERCLPLDIGITVQDWEWHGAWDKRNVIMFHSDEYSSDGAIAFGRMGGFQSNPYDTSPWPLHNGDQARMMSTDPVMHTVPQLDYEDHTYLRLTGTEFCMDLRDGKHEAGAIIQIWTCGDGNPNQMWSMSESGPWISKEEPEEE